MTPKTKMQSIALIVGISLVFSVLLFHAKALSDSDYNVRTLNNFDLYFPQGNSILFQIDTVAYNHVALNPVVGNLNGTTGQLWIAQNYGGQFSFQAQENCVVELTESLGAVKVTSGTITDTYASGDIVPINSGLNYAFAWSYTLAPMLPFSLIIGIIGVGMVFGGPIYAVHSFRQGEYRTALITCTIITLVGAALVIGWFYS